jgi:hypothetical protein
MVVLETHPQRGLMADAGKLLDWGRGSRACRTLRVSTQMMECHRRWATGVLPAPVTERSSIFGPPALGRVLSRDFADEHASRFSVMRSGHDTSAETGVLGALVRIDGEAYTVVGVMPAASGTWATDLIPWLMSADEQRAAVPPWDRATA